MGNHGTRLGPGGVQGESTGKIRRRPLGFGRIPGDDYCQLHDVLGLFDCAMGIYGRRVSV